MKNVLVILFSFMFLFANPGQAEELVTVKLVNYVGNTDELQFYLTGSYFSPDLLIPFSEHTRYRVKRKEGKLEIEGGGEVWEVENSFTLIPEKLDTHHVVRINRRPYLGAMTFQLEEQGSIRPINQLLLEDYLKGVVPFEVFPSWELEALKAQTLAARTYAVSHMKKVMDDTIQFQVYGGYDWHPRTSLAIEGTKGQVLTYENRLIEAFYSASNGGMTENNVHVWGGNPLPFYPIKLDPYDPKQQWEVTMHQIQIDVNQIDWDDPDYWENTVEKDEVISNSLKNWLSRKGYVGDIKILSIPEFTVSPKMNDSRRAVEGSFTVEFMIRLIDGTILFDQVAMKNVPLTHIRPAIGGTRFKSYLIDSLELKNGKYMLKGRGFGHGVGMSQWGAQVMGQKGKSYKEILQFYFPGTSIVNVYDKWNGE